MREACGYAAGWGNGSARETGNIVAGDTHLRAMLRTVIAEWMTPA